MGTFVRYALTKWKSRCNIARNCQGKCYFSGMWKARRNFQITVTFNTNELVIYFKIYKCGKYIETPPMDKLYVCVTIKC